MREGVPGFCQKLKDVSRGTELDTVDRSHRSSVSCGAQREQTTVGCGCCRTY